MKKSILLMFIITLMCSAVFADHIVQFTYDKAGNRTGRAIVLQSRSAERRGLEQADSTIAVYTDIFADLTLNVYPNPTHGQLRIELVGLPEGDAFQYMILSSGGNIIVQDETTDNPVDADLSECVPGLYILKLFYKSTEEDFKIIRL